MKLSKVTQYTPEVKRFGDNTIYFIDANGIDWYDGYKLFRKKYKLCVDPDSNVICSVSEDAGRLYPNGFDIFETNFLPDGFSIDGSWCFINGNVVPREKNSDDWVVQAENRKNELLMVASKHISVLQDAVDLGMATPDETNRLNKWKAYRVLVNRINTSENEHSWPVQPE